MSWSCPAPLDGPEPRPEILVRPLLGQAQLGADLGPGHAGRPQAIDGANDGCLEVLADGDQGPQLADIALLQTLAAGSQDAADEGQEVDRLAIARRPLAALRRKPRVYAGMVLATMLVGVNRAHHSCPSA